MSNARDHLEAFCCLQVIRIERILAHRYGDEYVGTSDSPTLRQRGRLNSLMPQNDHMTREDVLRHEPEVRR